METESKAQALRIEQYEFLVYRDGLAVRVMDVDKDPAKLVWVHYVARPEQSFLARRDDLTRREERR